jgi:hypothetical protein
MILPVDQVFNPSKRRFVHDTTDQTASIPPGISANPIQEEND